MNRHCSTGRKTNSQRRKLDEKIKTHFNVFRVNMNKRSMLEGDGGGSSDSLQIVNDLHSQPMDMHIPIQEANHYHQQQHCHQQHQQSPSSFDNNDDLLAWAQELPSAAFVDLIDTSNLDMALGQISPNFYQPVNIPLANNVHQPAVNTNNDHAMSFTNSFSNSHNASVAPQRSHYSYPSIFNYEQNTNDATFGSFSSSSTNTTNPFDHLNTIPHQQDASQLNHVHCNSMPSRPNPPIFKNGPSYLRASEDFILFFHAIDADDSGLITFDELKQYLRNKDANNTNFNNEAVMTLIEMFDTSEYENPEKQHVLFQ
ncbi:hypothetical protein MAM1_0075c04302 [Mucor ambiguus]|uniref:EF-hand domain-containing protein n=1 Tax=Mucor ambiguus TaxID=91626 RepID=A0A0C9MNM8_9FUNG|nr:hypothetical protein MAM1_0075c04302 [Mucor ambiguus]